MTDNNAVAKREPFMSARGVLAELEAGCVAVSRAVVRTGRGAVPFIGWAVTRWWWPWRGAGRIGGNVWRLCFPRYDQDAVSHFQQRARVRRWAAGVIGFWVVLPIVALIVSLIVVGLVDGYAGPVGVWLTAAAVAAGLFYAGRDLAPAIEGTQTTHDQDKIAEALAGRLPGVKEDMLQVSKPRREWTDAGTVGRSFTVTLPLWVEAGQVAQHRAVIAAALATKTDRITVTEGATPNRAVVFVADVSPSEMPPAVWPLTDADHFDVTRPIPIGVTPDGAPAHLQLFSRDSRGDLQGFHLLLTGMSGYGKSTLLQLILAACALDSRAVLNVAVLKDTRDFEDIAPALTFLAADATVDDLRAMLARAVAHMATRAGVPYVVVIDECQEQLGRNGDGEARELVRTLLAKGRSAGVAVVLVTQEPTAPNLEPELARRPQNRVSFRQSQDEAAGRAMGSGMTDATNPSKFGGGDQGLAAVIGEDGFRGRVKTPLLAPQVVARIAKDHAREPVEAEFPSYALDVDDQVQDPEPAPETAADHVRAVWPPPEMGVVRLQSSELQTLLVERFPRLYAGLDGKAFNAKLRAGGVPVVPGVRSVSDPGGTSATGVRWADVTGG